ncbi:MAG: peptide chain release factor N(5)-glutamine methyltransferase [Sulfobacillus thermosulfidooxidans]|nr:MAG: peptide chain release factor N(5)-glutamine methyltransferase [Sulfobacillus thermosulfidooxidans]
MTDTPSWRTLVTRGAARLASAGVEVSYREAQSLWCQASGVPLVRWLSGKERVTPSMRAHFEEAIDQRCQRVPYHYIVGRREFMGLDLMVDSRVLIPRPETEHLVERVLRDTAKTTQRIVDVGTGSGAVALALAYYGDPKWHIMGVDISSSALAVAQDNAHRIATRTEIQWIYGDLLDEVAGPLTVVVANLPYVDIDQAGELEPELQYEPACALYAPEQGLAVIKRLIRQLPTKLAMKGRVYLEIGAGQADAVEELLRDQQFTVLEREKDLAGIDRIICAERKA